MKTKSVSTRTPFERQYDNWEGYLKEFQNNAYNICEQNSDSKLYRTDTVGLFDMYLSNLPEDQGHYNCNACRQFIDRFGGLVFVKNGKVVPLFWNGSNAFPFFSKASQQLLEYVSGRTIVGVFKSESSILGLPHNVSVYTGYDWTHFNFTLPNSVYNTSSQLLDEHKYIERYEMLQRLSHGEVSLTTINKAIGLIDLGLVYRGNEDMFMLSKLKELLGKLNNTKILWPYVFGDESLYHVRGSALYTFLTDLQQNGDDVDSVIERYGYKKDPANYGRVKSEVSQTQINITQKYMVDNGLIDSLHRKFARLSELPKHAFIWQDKSSKKMDKIIDNTGFGNIKPKQSKPIQTTEVGKAVKMTYNKFVNTILPTLDSITVTLTDTSRLVGMTTEGIEGSGNIFSWNNPYAWYYNGGNADGEIRKRVEGAGGRYEDNDIRCSLMWHNTCDLDIHCITPFGEHIHFGNKKGKCGGWLDIDMNVHGETCVPVENMRWERGKAPKGRYRFYVHNYTRRNHTTPFTCELEVLGKVFVINGDCQHHNTAFEFDYGDSGIKIVNDLNMTSVSVSRWGLKQGESARVKAIIKSPNRWDDGITVKQPHTFFIIDGCEDDSGTAVLFMPEFLKNDLKPHRKVLEHYTKNNSVLGTGDCFGLGFNHETDWNLELTATKGEMTYNILIDRFE